jgi:hypothetical protein
VAVCLEAGGVVDCFSQKAGVRVMRGQAADQRFERHQTKAARTADHRFSRPVLGAACTTTRNRPEAR